MRRLLPLLLALCRTVQAQGIIMHSVLLDADLPVALPPGPQREVYRAQLQRQAARYGKHCGPQNEVMLTHVPDVLVEQMQEATEALWSPVGKRSGVWEIKDTALLVMQKGSAVLVCREAARVLG